MAKDDLQRFADCLRLLKERKGRSYEALAKRTGISSSALHRYCSGKGVPPDFGTAERIARACGADGDELLELHRHWMRAQAEQKAARPQEGESEPGGAAAENDPGPEPGPSPAHEPEPLLPRRTPFLRRSRLTGVTVIASAVVVAAASLIPFLLRGQGGPPAGAASSPPGDGRLMLSSACPPVLSMGEHDECVRELQTLLSKAGAPLEIDADFGPGTLRRVVAFQVLAGLPPNGLVDERTKRAVYAGGVNMRTWPPDRVERRIKEVFPEEPERAVGIARCMSFLDPHYVLPNVNGTRNWGVFQISDRRLAELGGTPRRAFDPEWNIQAARRLWSQHRDFRHWENCDQPYRKREGSGQR